MGDKIKLPKKFRSIIHNTFCIRGYQVMDAYVDENEFNINDGNGLKGLREFLGINNNESICDLLCDIKVKGESVKKYIFEDKKSHHQKSCTDAKKPLECTQKLLKEKHQIEPDYAVMGRVGIEPPFKAKTQQGFPFKAVYIGMNGKNVNLEGTQIPLLSY